MKMKKKIKLSLSALPVHMTFKSQNFSCVVWESILFGRFVRNMHGESGKQKEINVILSVS